MSSLALDLGCRMEQEEAREVLRARIPLMTVKGFETGGSFLQNEAETRDRRSQ